jgi:site-specific DNA-cytosine methylase
MNQWRALEFFAGIGGFSAALPSTIQVVSALDINQNAKRWYRHNFSHDYRICSIDGLSSEDLRQYDANFWWLSPPCQPFTLKGNRKDWDDPRNKAFQNLLKIIPQLRPDCIALENVPGFVGTQTHQRWLQTLKENNYYVRETLLCPSQFGIPNQRRRFYSVANTFQAIEFKVPQAVQRPLSHYISEIHAPDLWVPQSEINQILKGIHLSNPKQKCATTRCFTAGYGKNKVKSGSYLMLDSQIRYFHPTEVLKLLGFPEYYMIPPDTPNRQAWKLLGNSLSIQVVTEILSSFEGN